MPLAAASKEALDLAWLFLTATSAFRLIFFIFFVFFELAYVLFGHSEEYDSGVLYDEDEDEEDVPGLEEEEDEVVEFGFRSNACSCCAEVKEEENGGGDDDDDPCLSEDLNGNFHVGYAKEEEGEEEEVVIVEDITGREDSYLDEDFESDHRFSSSSQTTKLSKKQELPATTAIPTSNVPLSALRNSKESEVTEIEHEDVGKFSKDDKYLSFASAPKDKEKHFANNTLQDHQKRHVYYHDDHDDEPYVDSCTVGSTSKDSSEWRSSITFRDSVTDDPFSTSSRRSCPKWESYAIFQKYDEEMMILDRISANKLTETESLRSLKVQPRSISQRIVHQIIIITTTATASTSEGENPPHVSNPYNELEAAYVAQICLAWEVLNWNYNNFKRKQALLKQQATKADVGCPARVAQQFQQFQVLLQRFNESEPYEYGKRPEVYARTKRSKAPRLLMVPEYQDSCEDEEKEEEVASSRIPSESFLNILEESIRTFMNFLRADKEKRYQVMLRALIKRRKSGLVDPTLIKVMKKTNRKKKEKLKGLARPDSCLRKKKKLTREEEMEILMGLIDLKVVSRVLRMCDLSHDQLRWCDEKMTKLSLTRQGKLTRDSSPLFFPTH